MRFAYGKSGFFLTSEGIYGKSVPFANNFCPLENINYVRLDGQGFIALATDEGEIVLALTGRAEGKQEHEVLFSILHDCIEELKNAN